MKVFIDLPKAPPIEMALGRTLINDISVEESLDAAVQDLLATVPNCFLAQSISRKFHHQSVELTHKEAEQIADWMMNGQSGPSPFEGDADSSVIREFDSCDIAEIEQGIEDFVDRQLPNLPYSVAEEGAVLVTTYAGLTSVLPERLTSNFGEKSNCVSAFYMS